MTGRPLALPDFLAGYRALIKELFQLADGISPALWVDALLENPFTPPTPLHYVYGVAQWRVRFMGLMSSTVDT